MKLNLIAASLAVLGLASAPVFANHVPGHKSDAQPAHHDYKDYKDMGPKVCTITENAKALIEMSQNIGRALPNPCNPGWYDRIRVSGGINLDIGKWGNRNANLMGENYQRFSLNDVYINVAGNINDWTNVFASVNYLNATTALNPGVYNQVGTAEYSAAYSNNINSTSTAATVQIEQAFATIANFDVTPIYLQGGKFFQDFSRYEIHPITRSLTQVMSETLATSLKLGFIADGFNGGVYVFNDPIAKIGSSASPTNYGFALGYDLNDEQFGWDLGAAYMYNLMGANDVAWSVNNFTGGNGYTKRVGGVALYGDVNYGPFMVAVRYTQSVQRFNVNDLTKNGNNDLTPASVVIGTSTLGPMGVTPLGSATGAKPWAAGIQAGYGFEAWTKSQNVYIGYQASREAAGLNLPKNRWLVGYGIDILKDTLLAAEWDHDNQFSASNGGQGNNTNLVSLRAAVKFS